MVVEWQTVYTLFVDLDQTAPDLGLHCLLRPVCPKI